MVVLKHAMAGVSVILVGAVVLAPSKLLAAPKDVVSKVNCECTCFVNKLDGTTVTVQKTFRAPGGDGRLCTGYNATRCKIKSGEKGWLSGCESVVERGSSAEGAAPGDQPLAPVPPRRVAPGRVAPGDPPLVRPGEARDTLSPRRRDHRDAAPKPAKAPTAEPAPRPGYIWVDDHWERKKAK